MLVPAAQDFHDSQWMGSGDEFRAFGFTSPVERFKNRFRMGLSDAEEGARGVFGLAVTLTRCLARYRVRQEAISPPTGIKEAISSVSLLGRIMGLKMPSGGEANAKANPPSSG